MVVAELTCIWCDQGRLIDSEIASQGSFLSGLQVPITLKAISVPNGGASRSGWGHLTAPALDGQSGTCATGPGSGAVGSPLRPHVGVLGLGHPRR
jgi:hypothetical protein